MTNLSPAAQAVLDAFTDSDTIHGLHLMTPRLAAALRAVADQVVPLTSKPNDTFCIPPVATMVWMRETNIRKVLLAIAAELES
tara:strand:+ start:62 stop:310 length:249 start_codon:yes stop_codon:yes gene_type:complete